MKTVRFHDKEIERFFLTQKYLIILDTLEILLRGILQYLIS